MDNEKEIIISEDWTSTWHNKAFCGNCGGIFDFSDSLTCSVCSYSYRENSHKIMIGEKETEVTDAFAGAISWTTYLLLRLMKEEWIRPIIRELFDNHKLKTSPRAMVVILFWTHFESLMEQLLTAGMKNLPSKISDHLLKRNPQISNRIYTLYPLVFDSSFNEDISKVGYPYLVQFLKKVQDSRNSFMHGNPEHIDEDLVLETAKNIQDVQIAWIKLYNLKCANL